MGGFFGFFDYSKPGKGVEKEDFKPNFSTFFRIFFERFWKLIQLNLIYILCSLPLIAAMFLYFPVNTQNQDQQVIKLFGFCVGSLLYLSVVGLAPIITGFTFVLRNYSKDQHSWVFSDFFEHIKKNFKQAMVVLLIDVVFSMVIPFLYSFYTNIINSSAAGEGISPLYGNLSLIARTFIIIFTAVYFIMHFYIYEIMVTFDMKLKQIYKNSLIFALAHLPRNIGVLILITAVAVLTFGFTTIVGVLISVLISVSFIGYIVNFIVQPVIAKHMIKAEEE